MNEPNDIAPDAVMAPINTGELLKAIRVICCLLLAGSGLYALAAAMKISKFTVIFKEMLGDTEMPLASAVLTDYPMSFLFIPIFTTSIGIWFMSMACSAHRTLYYTAGLTLLNIMLAMFIDWALFQPLITIITKFQPG
jgi:hypothetical protein